MELFLGIKLNSEFLQHENAHQYGMVGLDQGNPKHT